MSAADLLAGAFDTHLHATPDVIERSANFLEAAALAQAAGMAGIVFKDLSASTVDRAFAVQERHPDLKAYGGVVLDGPVGGLNPLAVETALRRGARVVWMPVVDARNTIAKHQSGAIRLPVPPRWPLPRGLTVLGQDGRLTAEAVQVLQLIADADAVLATGHLEPRESIALLRRARDMGIRRMVVTHPMARVIAASIDEQRAMADLGAMLEHCAAQTTRGLDGLSVAAIADAIQAVGPSRCLLASDLGQTFNPPFTEGLIDFLGALQRVGVADNDLRLMVQSNPRLLLE